MSKLNAEHRQALVDKVERGPIPAVDGVVRWRLKDQALWIFEDFGISLDETTLGRGLKALGFRKLSARPAITPRTAMPSRISKKVPRRTGGDPGQAASRNRCRV